MGHEACVGRIRSVCSFGQKLKRREHLRHRRRQEETLKWIFSRNLWGGWVCVDWPYLGIYEHINELQVLCRWGI